MSVQASETYDENSVFNRILQEPKLKRRVSPVQTFETLFSGVDASTKALCAKDFLPNYDA